ncbi:MAG: iron(III) transport system ATP-binding protein [Bradyrhizobium sp.]|jgi:iron(III) transport system ATP-binding protein|nr:iron(III) transport system ATP-binding protein [Bradyrhizobium sp.]
MMSQLDRDPAAAAAFNLRAVDLRIAGVSVSYGSQRVLTDVDLDIRPGEFFGLLGPSGCGKTTLLRLIAGFAQSDAGRIVVGGKEISHLPPWKRGVGMVFQSYALWPHMTVARNVAFGLEEQRVPKADIARRVTAALDLVGLSSLAERRPSQLSGGQQQRVALARTIAVEPKILLLDEPLSNLDAKLRLQVRRELRELQQRLGLTTILVTHDQEEANTICDRVAVMNAGRVQQVGSPIDLYEKPQNLFVANFLGTANIIEGRVTGLGADRMFAIDGGMRVPIPPEAAAPEGSRMMFRPQDATIVAGDRADPNQNLTEGKIVYREFLGSTVRYSVRVGAIDLWVDSPFRSGDRIYDIDQTVGVSISARSARWLAD